MRKYLCLVVTTLLASLCLNANKVFEVDGLWYEEVSMTGGTPGDNEVFVTRIHGNIYTITHQLGFRPRLSMMGLYIKSLGVIITCFRIART